MKRRASIAIELTPQAQWVFKALLVIQAIAALALAGVLPAWVIAAALLGLAVHLSRLRRERSALPAWLLGGLGLLAVAAVIVQFHSLNGRDAGVSLLLLAGILKSHEVRRRRDLIVLIYLGYLLVLARFLFDQSLPWVAYALLMTFALTMLLQGLHTGRQIPPWSALARQAAFRLGAALPLTLLLFALFPRIEGPLWGSAPQSRSAVTGLSNVLAPGSFAHLAQSQAVAFRASFPGNPPPPSARYWRAYVMERFDGRQWLPPSTHESRPGKLQPLGSPLRYTLLLQANGLHVIPALDVPPTPPPGVRLINGHVLRTPRPVEHTQEYRLTAVLRYRLDPVLHRLAREAALQLPPGVAPKARALAQAWRKSLHKPRLIVERTLAYFHDQDFYYTLNPPPLHGDITDDFLFHTRKGYCEQYASAFAVLMRAAGIPARIVTGYAGGQWNPVLHYLLVRQANAHAWVEVWLANQGWVRVDPTAAVAQSRIENNTAPALSGTQIQARFRVGWPQSWLTQLRLAWDSVQYTWALTVIAFGPEQQRAFFRSLGLSTGGIAQGFAIVLSIFISFLLWMAFDAMRPTFRKEDPAQRLYLLWLRKLASIGLQPDAGETPIQFALKVGSQCPASAQNARRIVQAYEAARYAPADELEIRQRLLVLEHEIKSFRCKGKRSLP